MLVNQAITEKREKAGLTIVQLAEKVGVSHTTISRYERGETKSIPADMIIRLATALDIPVSDLIDDDPRYDAVVPVFQGERKKKRQTVAQTAASRQRDLDILTNCFPLLSQDLQNLVLLICMMAGGQYTSGELQELVDSVKVR